MGATASNEQQPNETIKEPQIQAIGILLVGSQRVGKTTILSGLCGKTSPPSQDGIDSGVIRLNSPDKSVIIQLWDPIDFDEAKRHSYRGRHACFLMYDVTRKQTLDEVLEWKTWNDESNPTAQRQYTLIGNKIDLENQREVSTEDGKQLANLLNITFFEISGETGEKLNGPLDETVDKFCGESVRCGSSVKRAKG